MLLLEPRLFEDHRGWLFEEYQEASYASLGLPTRFRQENRSRSKRNVVRGLHYQLTRPQGKLVTCTLGRIWDVAVDIRRGSPTFGQWAGAELSADAPRLLWIPPGFAHGFCALTELADVAYKLTEVYARDDERGILWRDPGIGIEWPVSNPIESPRDADLPLLSEAATELPEWTRP